MAAPPGGGGRLQATLHSAVQSIRWTYTIFWQLCPRQGALVWGDGYYNGEIKTRKTVQSMEVSAEEASLQRSQQLRELYDSLSAGETNQPPPKRPCAALSPEDLTETEWFYLMCVSFSFAPGVGIPGKAYAKRQHVWLGGANEQDSKVFTRAILAKSARIQTVLCIPVAGGIVEFGSTELIKEDKTLVQHLKTYFPVNMNPRQPPPKPALSEQSTSNPVPATSSDSHYRHLLHSSSLPAIFSSASQLPTSSNNNTDTNNPSRVNEEEVEDEAEGEPGSEAEIETRNVPAAEPKSDLMQVETSEDIRLGSPDDASNNLGPEFPSVGPILVRTDLATRPSSVQEVRGPVQPALFSGAAELEELTEEDAHYSRTVSVLLQHQSAKWPDAVNGYIFCSSQSAFAKWTSLSDSLHHFNEPTGKTSSQQGFLKYILLSVPFLHSTNRDEGSSKARPEARDSSSFDRFKKGAFGQEEAGVNHVMAERRRREKLNEKFIILRSLVPFVTKMDKASILADTIEYVKQLRKKIAELEEKKSRQNEVVQRQRPRTESPPPCTAASISDVGRRGSNEGNGPRGKKMRAVEEIAPKPVAKVVEPLQKDAQVQVQVSIIECDALVEIQCRYREGLLLDVMVALRELGIETTAVQSFVKYGKFEGEVRAKVKRDKVSSGKKVTIAEVKRAIYQIIPLEA